MIGIYKITSPTGKQYIGSSCNIERRWKTYQGLRCKDQPKIYNSLIKYGVENHFFEVLQYCPIEVLLLREQEYLDIQKPELNICKIAGSLGYGSNHPSWKGGAAAQKAYRKEYYLNNKEKIIELQKQNPNKKNNNNNWRSLNKDAINLRRKIARQLAKVGK